jgi:hypothetical protein
MRPIGLETVRAKPCWSRLGLRTMTSGEASAIVRTPGGNRDVSSSRSPALSWASEPPKGRDIWEVGLGPE